jgi:hypothetical protein
MALAPGLAQPETIPFNGLAIHIPIGRCLLAADRDSALVRFFMVLGSDKVILKINRGLGRCVTVNLRRHNQYGEVPA